MPTYEYKCPQCGHQFEQFQKMTAKPVAKCPKCGAKAERQLSAGGGLVFKGSGFYITDYKRAGEKKDGGEKSSESRSESKSDAKSETPKPKKKKDE